MLYRYKSLHQYTLVPRKLYSSMSTNYVKRTTIFKIPKEEDIDTVIKQYEILRKTAVKASKVINALSPS